MRQTNKQNFSVNKWQISNHTKQERKKKKKKATHEFITRLSRPKGFFSVQQVAHSQPDQLTRLPVPRAHRQPGLQASADVLAHAPFTRLALLVGVGAQGLKRRGNTGMRRVEGGGAMRCSYHTLRWDVRFKDVTLCAFRQFGFVCEPLQQWPACKNNQITSGSTAERESGNTPSCCCR